MTGSKLSVEDEFALQIGAFRHLIDVEREWQLHPRRKWRLDFALWNRDGKRVAVEIQGGGGSGRHGSSGGLRLDCEKTSACACLGWTLIKADSTQVRSGKALAWALCAVGIEPGAEALFDKPRSQSIPGRHRPKPAKPKHPGYSCHFTGIGAKSKALACLPDRVLAAARRGARRTP